MNFNKQNLTMYAIPYNYNELKQDSTSNGKFIYYIYFFLVNKLQTFLVETSGI